MASLKYYKNLYAVSTPKEVASELVATIDDFYLPADENGVATIKPQYKEIASQVGMMHSLAKVLEDKLTLDKEV